MTHKSKLLKAIIVMLSVCLTCGCSLSSDENVVSIKNHAGEINEKLESCLKEEDADGLKTLFCQKLLNNYTHLDEDISDAFQFIEGDIISFGNTVYGEQSSMREYEWTEYKVTPRIRKVKTSEEKEYSILYYNILVYDEEPERIGVSEIMITDTEDDSKFIIGDYYIVNPEAKH